MCYVSNCITSRIEYRFWKTDYRGLHVCDLKFWFSERISSCLGKQSSGTPRCLHDYFLYQVALRGSSEMLLLFCSALCPGFVVRNTPCCSRLDGSPTLWAARGWVVGGTSGTTGLFCLDSSSTDLESEDLLEFSSLEGRGQLTLSCRLAGRENEAYTYCLITFNKISKNDTDEWLLTRVSRMRNCFGKLKKNIRKPEIICV